MNLANKFSFVRLLLTPIFVLSVLYYRADNPVSAVLPIAVFLTAVMTDAIDGYIARRFAQTTRFGAVLDPLADKFLIIVAFITLTFTKTIPPHLRIPPWVLTIVLTRDIFIITGSLVIFVMFEYIEFKPSALGKVTTFFQMMTVSAVLLRYGRSDVIWNITAFFTVASGIHYLIRTNRVLNGKNRHAV